MYKKFFIFCIVLITSSCKHKVEESFFNNLSKHCGKTYSGKTVYPENPGENFANKKLLMHVKDCSKTEIRVPFKVGEDTSRTWVFTKTDRGLLLKHDHRHADGTADEVSMYGGYADEKSTAIKHSFKADKYTSTLIPEASSNVWILSFDEKKQTFSYYLERHSKARYKAIFSLKENE